MDQNRDRKITGSAFTSLLSKDYIYLSVIGLLVAVLFSGYNAKLPTAVTTNMTISEGSRIPSRSLKEDNVMEASVNLATIPGKVIIVGVPGAFTPTCSNQVPSYYDHASTFASKGIQGIYVVSVNDAFITQAWKKTFYNETENSGTAKSILHFLADDTGEWTKEAGLEIDMTAVVGGRRSKRYAAIVEDGILRHLLVEDDPSVITVSHAENVVKYL